MTELWQTSLEMARIAAADGIQQLIATPHVMKGAFENTKEAILAITRDFNHKLKQENIDLLVMPGAEYYFEPDLAERAARGELLTLNDTGRYILVEFSSAFIPDYAESILYDLQIQGMTPVIAHPERNQVLSSNPQILAKLVEHGMLAQVTVSSITGLFGKGAQKSAFKLIEARLIHLVVSDAHSTRGRTPQLSPAYKILSQKYGNKYAHQIMISNPRQIIVGLDLAAQVSPRLTSWTHKLKQCFGLG